MNYITMNKKRIYVDDILDFEEVSEEYGTTMLAQEAYKNDKLVAYRLIYDIRKPRSDYDWMTLEAEE